MAEHHGDLAGMTVNERLFTLGLLDAWDDAVRRRDRPAMMVMMQTAEVENGDWTVDTVLAGPSFYGFQA